MQNRQVAFMARVTAGMTHDLRNVLAIIKESSGLLQDILGLEKSHGVPQSERIEKVVARIQRQLARGNEQLSSLNWLAHRMSDRSSSVGINELSSEVVNLMQRFARLEQVALEARVADHDVEIHTDVALLLPVLAGCIEYFLKRESPKGRVVLRSRGRGGEATLEIVTESTDGSGMAKSVATARAPLPAELANLELLVEPLGARLEFAGEEGGAELHIIVPLRRDVD